MKTMAIDNVILIIFESTNIYNISVSIKVHNINLG